MGLSLSSYAFHPPPRKESDSAEIGKVSIGNGVSVNVKIVSSYMSSTGTSNNRLVFLYSHGNAEDLLSHGATRRLYEISYAYGGSMVIGYDYPGYGGNRGVPTQTTVYKTIIRVYDECVPKENTNLVLWGRSLGTAPSCFLARELMKRGTPAHTVILESGMSSGFRWKFNLDWSSEVHIPFDVFSNIEIARGGFGCVTYLVHGEVDEIVNNWHSKALSTAIGKTAKLYYVKGKRHNDVTVNDVRRITGSL